MLYKSSGSVITLNFIGFIIDGSGHRLKRDEARACKNAFFILCFEAMSSPELAAAREAVATDIDALIYMRVNSATPIKTLSERADKLLQVVQEANGQKFVTRRFSRDAISVIEESGLSFTEAWRAMYKQFGNAGINIVPSYLLATEEPYPLTAVGKYLENGQSLIGAPTALKVRLADNLGKMLRGRYMLHPQMLNRDMFMFDSTEDGSVEAFLVDLDPIMMPRPNVAHINIFPGRALI